MRHDTRATHFKAHLYSLECRKYTNYFSKKGIRNSQSNMQTTSISPQNRTKIQSLQN